MSNILLIETATNICSVALCSEGKIVSIKESSIVNSHSATITTFIDEVFHEASLRFSDLSAVCVSKGPGSYTGLRIGVSTAKGLCYALGIPLLSVSTLESMTRVFLNCNTNVPNDTLFCPMIDARRMEVYTALFDKNLKQVEAVSAKIIDQESFLEELKQNKVYFFGDGALKCKSILENHENALFIDDFQHSSSGMANLSKDKFEFTQFENVAYFEPYYLKDFVATIPRKIF